MQKKIFFHIYRWTIVFNKRIIRYNSDGDKIQLLTHKQLLTQITHFYTIKKSHSKGNFFQFKKKSQLNIFNKITSQKNILP
jgi:hypothetical protein